MKAKAIVFCCCFMFWSVVSHAEDNVGTQQEAVVTVKYASLLGGTLQLQVAYAPLRKVLDELSRVTETGIHYSVLADERVSATCAGDSLKKVLKCLLGDSRNMVFQYAQSTEKVAGVRKPVDVWILGSSLTEPVALRNSDSCEKVQGESLAINKALNVRQADERLLAKLMLGLASKDPKQRADAIADLATKTAMDNTEIDDALLKAMDDEAVIVKEQALFGWVYRKGDGATAELQHALQDTEMSVRLKVVDLTQNRALLTQATADSSKLVRQLAQMKLDDLDLQVKKINGGESN
jgi:hypothetical protein